MQAAASAADEALRSARQAASLILVYHRFDCAARQHGVPPMSSHRLDPAQRWQRLRRLGARAEHLAPRVGTPIAHWRPKAEGREVRFCVMQPPRRRAVCRPAPPQPTVLVSEPNTQKLHTSTCKGTSYVLGRALAAVSRETVAERKQGMTCAFVCSQPTNTHCCSRTYGSHEEFLH